jgi:flagellar hook-associated protein 2
MAISSTGIGSGLDVNTIVTQLMAAESGPLTILQTKQTANNAKLSAFGSLKSAVATFQTALNGLGSTTLGARAATSSDATTLGVSASSDAVAGTYAIEVTQLAKQYKLSSAGHADATAQLGTGTMSIQVGGKAAVAIPAGDYTMKSLSDAINSAQAGVTATIVNDGSAAGNRLVITANDSGLANSIKITAGGALGEFSFDPAAPPDPASTTPVVTQNQAGQDAILKIDNLTVTKPSNNITDAVSGLTLNLLKTNVGAPLNVAVAVDKAAAKTAVSAFVDAYNKLNSTIKTMTAYNATTKTGAVLNGDFGAESIVTALRKQMTTGVASTGAGSLTSLSQIGVAFQRDGTLAVDDTKLQTALDSNFAGVNTLFSGTDGYATRLTAVTTDILSSTGVISSRTDGLNNAIKQNAASQDDMNTRLALIEKRYRAQFSSLDTLMSQMQSTSTFLTQQLAALTSNGA